MIVKEKDEVTRMDFKRILCLLEVNSKFVLSITVKQHLNQRNKFMLPVFSFRLQ